MNTLVVLSAIVASVVAGDEYYIKKGHNHLYGPNIAGPIHGGMIGGGGAMPGSIVGGGGMPGSIGGGGGIIAGPMHGGMVGGGGAMPGSIVGGGGMPGSIGGGGGIIPIYIPKYGTCPHGYRYLELGPVCHHDDDCHGSQKCCASIHGLRCQIPLEYQRPGTCHYNLETFPLRRACNDDAVCPYGSKCCRRAASGQVDTCTRIYHVRPVHGGPHQFPGNPGGHYPMPSHPGSIQYPTGHKKNVY